MVNTGPYLHSSDPHAERLGGQGHLADDVGLKVGHPTVLANFLEDAV